MKRLTKRLYYWFWHDVLELPKPITNVTRDEVRENPLALVIASLLLGIALVKWSGSHWWQSLVWLGVGILIGHVFW